MSDYKTCTECKAVLGHLEGCSVGHEIRLTEMRVAAMLKRQQDELNDRVNSGGPKTRMHWQEQER